MYDDIRELLIDKNGRTKSNLVSKMSKMSDDQINRIHNSYPEYTEVIDKLKAIIYGGYKKCLICNKLLPPSHHSDTCGKICGKQLQQKTNLEKYGVKCTFQSKEFKEKSKRTLLEKYGVDTISKSQEIRNKIKQTNLDKYGVEYPLESQEVQDKIKQTNIEKYGVEYPLESQKVQDKIKQTNLEKYGVDNIFKLSEFKEVIKYTNLIKYGCDNVNKNKTIRDKIKQTNIEKYGVTCPLSTTQYIDHSKIMRLHRICDYIFDRTGIAVTKDEAQNLRICLEKDYSKEYLIKMVEYIRNGTKPTYYDIINEYDSVSNYKPLILWYGLNYNLTTSKSKHELEIFNYVKSLGVNVISGDRNIIKPLELDIYIPEYNLAIEFNGDYWHSSKFIPSKYHQNKTKLCNEKGITLIHIYEYLYNKNPSIYYSIIKAKLGLNERVYARKCTLKEVSKTEEGEFLDNYHLQGYTPSKICYGLYYNNQLVSLCSFKKSRFDKNYEYELLRNCTISDITVVGGLSKLINHFKSEYNQSEIICYSDASISFNKGGSLTTPNYIWIKGNIVYKRYQTMKHLLPKLLGDNFDHTLTEKENMINNGFMQIFDAGNYKNII